MDNLEILLWSLTKKETLESLLKAKSSKALPVNQSGNKLLQLIASWLIAADEWVKVVKEKGLLDDRRHEEDKERKNDDNDDDQLLQQVSGGI